MSDQNKLEATLTDIWKNGQYLRVIFVYNPPRNILESSSLENEINNNTIILGDFNAPSDRWGYTRTTAPGKAVECFVDSNPIEIIRSHNDISTFISFKGEQSTPDLVMSHSSIFPQITKNIMESPSGYGHRAIITKFTNRSKPTQHKDNLPRWNFRSANWEKYHTITDDKITHEIIFPGNPDKTITNFNTILTKCALLCIPRGKVKKYKPFWSNEIEQLKRKRDTARRKAEETGLLNDMCDLRKKQAMLTKKIKESKKKTFKNFVAKLDYKNDGLKTHKFLSSLNNDNCNQKTVPLKIGTKEIFDNKKKALAMAKHYSQTCRLPKRKVNLQHKPITSCLNQFENELFYSNFTICELNTAFKQSKTGKSAGPDNLPVELYINMGEKAKGIFLGIINEIWNIRVPASWKKAEIIPILKKDKDPSLPESYRPISLTNSACKLMERMIVNRLNQYLTKNKILTTYQAGFRKYRSTTEQAIYFSEAVKNGFNRKQSTLATFVDFKSAYDRVWRKMLIHKLVNYGLAGNMLRWIKSFLCQRMIRTKIQNDVSKYVHQKEGLPQGSVISCILFNLAINDLAKKLDEIPGINYLLYADDVVLYATSSSFSGLNQILNEGLKKFSDWCDLNQMIVNTEKTVSQLFTLSTKEHNIDLYYRGMKIKEDEAVYLGVHFDRKLTFNRHVKATALKAEKRLTLLKRLTGIKWGASEDMLNSTYKQYVRPVLEYGQELLLTSSSATTSILDKVQNKALRIVTGAAKSTPIVAMEIQTNTCPLGARREEAGLKLYEKIIRQNFSHWNINTARNRLVTQKSFLDEVKILKSEYGLETYTEQQFITNTPTYLLKPIYSLDIGVTKRKNECLIPELRENTLHMIETRYKDWLHVYTDGSADRLMRTAGAGIYCRNKFEASHPVGRLGTNFDAEICAVNHALIRLSSLDPSRVVLFIDSIAAILAIVSDDPPETTHVKLVRQCLNNLLTKNWTIALQWIPGHCGVSGNEMADQLAKRGCLMDQPDMPLSYNTVKSWIQKFSGNKVKEVWATKVEGKKYCGLLKENIPHHLPRNVFVANFRCTTGHDYLPAHLSRIGILNNPSCPLCNNNNFDATHLCNCSLLGEANFNLNLDDLAERYWSARRLIAEKQVSTGVG